MSAAGSAGTPPRGASGRHRAGRDHRRWPAAAAAAVICVAVVAAVVVFLQPSGSEPDVGAGPGPTFGAGPTTTSSSAASSLSATEQPQRTRSPSTGIGLPRRAPGRRGPAHPPSSAAPVAAPARVEIARIGVDSSLQSLSRLSDGTLEPPSQWDVAGWYSGGPRPGAVGPAVIAGHVDSTLGPAVFYRLDDLRVGDRVRIVDTDGTVLRFAVDDIRRYPKLRFPTEAVFGPTAVPELRLVTCTGDFDESTLSYLDNLVVSAHLLGR